MKLSPEITANRPSCVDQERTSLGKPIVSIITQLKKEATTNEVTS